MTSCAQCGQENPDGFRYCGACGAPLVRQAGDAPEVRKVVTIVFCDVAGSTALGERVDPEALRATMSRYFARMRSIIERHGGLVEKFIGDAVMAVFGIPSVHEDDAVRAVRAAADMRHELGALNRELESDWGVGIRIRTGINTGEVVAGDPASGQTLVTGDAVNVAARLEQAAAPGDVLIGRDTYVLVRSAAIVEQVAPLDLKGKAAPVEAYRLVDVLPEGPVIPRSLESPIVGRTREAGHVRAAFERAVAERVCYLFTILGAAGVGKSRLTSEVLEELSGRATVLTGRCLSYGEGITFWPLKEVVGQAAGTSGRDRPDEAFERIRAVVADDDEGERVAAGVAQLLGIADGSESTDEAFWAVRRFFETLARDRPLVVAFDDVHWAEPTFLDLVENVADWSRDVPILLLCAARSELLDLRPAWGGGKLNATSMLLEPLSDDDACTLVGNLVGDDDVPQPVRDRIVRAAEGNPLFVEEMLAMLADDGSTGTGRRRIEGDVAVPPTIQALLAARLDRLEPAERCVLERAAVAGREFHLDAVKVLSPEIERDGVGALLMSLVRKELVRPERSAFGGQDAFRFRHALVRDAAYESLPKEVRAELHERFARWLDDVARDRMREYEEIVAYHLERAYSYRASLGPVDAAARALGAEAGARLAAAGRRALARGDMPAAVSLLWRARSLLPADDARRLEIAPDIGHALVETGQFARAEVVLDEAIEAARAAGDRRLEAHATAERAEMQLYVNPELTMEKLREQSLALVATFEEFGDEAGLAKAWSLLGEVDWQLSRFGDAEESIRQVIEHAARAGDRREHARAVGWYAVAAVWGPTPVADGIARCERILEEYRGHRTIEARVVPALASLKGMQGEFDEAHELFATARAVHDDLGRMRAAAFTDMSGITFMYQGDDESAERELRTGFEALQEMGEISYLSTSAGLLAHAAYRQGRLSEVERLVGIARETAAEDDVMSQVLWRAALAKVHAARGELDAAEPLARAAAALSATTDDLNMHGHTLLDLADVLEAAGRHAEALAHARAALDALQRKGNVMAAARARASCERLHAPTRAS
ncbi:MAG TPA: adenylate/guanylate cyclase domain-containing protein [Actinomycetota bacterium]|nr:adenylate/guanylate cyclase domain-containing protein [Actinomycetota bacterium]